MPPERSEPPATTETRSPEDLLVRAAGSILLGLFVWFEWRLLLLCFAGLLLSVVLHAAASWVARHTRLKQLPSYLLTLLALAGLTALAGFLLVPRAVSQISAVVSQLPGAIGSARAYLQQRPWGSSLLDLLHRAMLGTGGRMTLVAKEAVQTTADLVVVLVIGFFGALNPASYREGILALLPRQRRAPARALSAKVAAVLRSWLLGQLIPMTVLGVCSFVGLFLLHVPLAFTLGLLTGVLIFVPYVGSAFSGLLAVLLALQNSPRTALYVFLLYCGVHLMEGYVLTPLVQKRAVRLPPILTILFQLFFWGFGGVLGVAVAAPFAAVVLVTVDILYLKPSPGEPGRARSGSG